MTTKTKKRSRKKSDDTSASLIISCHYQKLKIRERWDKARVDRLCRFLNITRHELETLVGGKVERVDEGKRLSMSICLILTMIESTYLGNYAPDIVTNLFDFAG